MPTTKKAKTTTTFFRINRKGANMYLQSEKKVGDIIWISQYDKSDVPNIYLTKPAKKDIWHFRSYRVYLLTGKTENAMNGRKVA